MLANKSPTGRLIPLHFVAENNEGNHQQQGATASGGGADDRAGPHRTLRRSHKHGSVTPPLLQSQNIYQTQQECRAVFRDHLLTQKRTRKSKSDSSVCRHMGFLCARWGCITCVAKERNNSCKLLMLWVFPRKIPAVSKNSTVTRVFQ